MVRFSEVMKTDRVKLENINAKLIKIYVDRTSLDDTRDLNLTWNTTEFKDDLITF